MPQPRFTEDIDNLAHGLVDPAWYRRKYDRDEALPSSDKDLRISIASGLEAISDDAKGLPGIRHYVAELLKLAEENPADFRLLFRPKTDPE